MGRLRGHGVLLPDLYRRLLGLDPAVLRDIRDAELVAAAAGAMCVDAGFSATKDLINTLGGIGFTWEHPAHLFLRRARTGRQLFGSSRDHRERYLAAKGA